jgi:hypothetical protein
MFVNDYNPLYDDVFLYSGFTGYPIGLNTNHPLYNTCKDYFLSYSSRPRVYDLINPNYPSGPPANVPQSQYPNYWNNQNALSWFISPTVLQSSMHFSNASYYPSDSPGYNSIVFIAKKSGLTAPNYYPFLSGATSASIVIYGPFYNMYNYVRPSDLYDTIGLPYLYFTGSPEVPGSVTGATYYQVSAYDVGILDQVTPVGRTVGIPIYDISIPNMIETLGYTFNYYTLNNQSPGYCGFVNLNAYTIKDNIWVRDSQDRMVPAYVYIFFNPITSGQWSFKTFGPRIGYGYNHDSSSTVFWYNNNKIYKLGHVDNIGTHTDDGTLYNCLNGTLHSSHIVPTNRYFIDQNIFGITHMQNTNGSTLGAYGPDINSMVNGLSACISNALTTLSSIWS